ncbi:IniB N-terminal domain-containing protein [Pseudonocardia sp. H11422]|uniref:IniB N-terminal domain-containing protein n=1 Tax=Pseudonocardia sp. H11422 TaxID=2835866 RepID=UPI001BDCAA11|nr:IniB N-terminal domain-containing protein [Pseudonocardia sp. H11422]
MAEQFSLLEFILHLINDEDARAEFNEDPYGELADHGLENLSAEDVYDALVLIEDNQTASFERDYNTGGNHNQVHLPPPPAHHDHHGDGAESHKAGVEYLNKYITNNYVDDRDTIVDNSVNQQIDTGGGDFRQDIDVDSVVASGDGAVAAGGDIEDSTITTGDGNVVGDGNNVVNGDDNTTAFGNGNATSTDIDGDVTLGDGAAFASGGNATVDNTDRSVNDSHNDNSDRSVNDSHNDYSDNSRENVGNVDVDASVNDSHNDNSQNTIEDSGNTTIDTSTEDSFNTEVEVG